jgi:hypothetical protein
MMSFHQVLLERTTEERTRLLAIPLIGRALRGEISLDQYIAFLTEAYHHVRHTVPLLMACGARLGDQRTGFQSAIAEYIAEEIGHDEWILSDIAACGGDALAARNKGPSAACEMMVAYAYHQIDRGNPMGFFGMVHVLEGTSVALASRAAQVMASTLGLPANAFRYLNSHGSLDLDHVRFFEQLMDSVNDPDDQGAIVHCAKRFYGLYGDIFRSLPAPSSRADDLLPAGAGHV